MRALYLANDEAIRLRHDHVATGHLLLGVLRFDHSRAARALVGLGVNPTELRSAIEARLDPGTSRLHVEPQLTPGSRKAIQFAVDEARRLDLQYMGTEHLLLGLIREGEGIAARVLDTLGVEIDRARLEVERLA